MTSTLLSPSPSSLSVRSDGESVNNIVKLKLKKPKSWNWELSTSASSSLIAFPRILLYDNKNKLLADVEEADCIVNGDVATNTIERRMVNGVDRSASSRSFDSLKRTANSRHSSTSKLSSSNTVKSSSSFSTPKNGRVTFNIDEHEPDPPKRTHKCKRSLSTNASKASRAVDELVDDVVSQLQSKGYECKVRRKSNSERYVNKCEKPQQSIDKQPSKQPSPPPTPPPAEIPIYIHSAKGLVRRDFNAKEFDEIRNREMAKLPNNKDKRTHSFDRNDTASMASHRDKLENPNLNHMHDATHRNQLYLQKSKSAVEMPQRPALKKERRKSCRTHSVNNVGFSSSILERLSAFKARSSSTDSQQYDVMHFDAGDQHFVKSMESINKPKYQLRTSAAGTLVVREESIRNRRMRRRPKSCGKINEVDENDCPYEQKEKFVRKYVYSGQSVDCAKRDCTPKKTPTYSTADKFPSRYEKAMANIDHLITNVILSRTDADIEHPFDDANNGKVKIMPSTGHRLKHKNDDAECIRNAHKNSISFLIKNDANNQLSNGINTDLIVHSNDFEDCSIQSASAQPIDVVPLSVVQYDDNADVDVIVVTSNNNNNNADAKQKTKRHNRKVSFNQGDGAGDGVSRVNQFNGSVATNATSAKLKDYYDDEMARKIQRSASAGSFRANRLAYTSSSSSEDDGRVEPPKNRNVVHRRRTKRMPSSGGSNNSIRSNGKCIEKLEQKVKSISFCCC